MQKEIIDRVTLLDADGNLAEPGYAKKFLFEYNRENVKASKMRLKEWDYYYIGVRDYAICLTVSDMGYLGALSATFMDFKTPSQITKSAISLFPLGKYNMPVTSERGDVSVNIGQVAMRFENDGKTRRLYGSYPKFGNNKELLSFDIILDDVPEESMVIATPFNKPKHFYFNQKINCIRARGSFSIGEVNYPLDGAEALATLDWGRGVWTYDNTWYWGSLSARLEDGSTFGWNIGYGFGDTSAATENMLFYRGKAHKLEDVTFNIPLDAEGKEEYMKDWTFTSSDGRFEMTFKPIIDRFAPVDLKVFGMVPHQVFGLFTGTAILDDGKKIEVKDLLGFAEKVRNKW